MGNLKELADALQALTPEQKKELDEVHNLRALPVRIKPATGGCTAGSCGKGYYCDAQSGQCILEAGG